MLISLTFLISLRSIRHNKLEDKKNQRTDKTCEMATQ